MAANDKKAEPARKKDTPAKDNSTSGDAAPAKANETAAPAKGGEPIAPAKAGETAAPAKAEASETGAPPTNYSRGEGQKPVTQAYKDNWNAIFANKSVKKPPKKSAKKSVTEVAKKKTLKKSTKKTTKKKNAKTKKR